MVIAKIAKGVTKVGKKVVRPMKRSQGVSQRYLKLKRTAKAKAKEHVKAKSLAKQRYFNRYRNVKQSLSSKHPELMPSYFGPPVASKALDLAIILPISPVVTAIAFSHYQGETLADKYPPKRIVKRPGRR